MIEGATPWGIESYILRLHGNDCDSLQIADYAQRCLGVVPDIEQSPLSDACSYYVYRDGLHVIEYELLQDHGSCQVTMRFALCHPSSVDSIFIQQAIDLMKHFNMEATICDELPDDALRTYTMQELARFKTNCAWSIACCREHWQQMFGTETIGLSVSDALQRFFHGLPV